MSMPMGRHDDDDRRRLPDVTIVTLPQDASLLASLRSAGMPRLVLVPQDADAPIGGDAFEDWVRLPADPRDVHARITTLQLRASARPLPFIDEHGCLHVDDRWIAIPPIEARILAVLIEHFGRVVSNADLAAGAWPEGLSSASQLRVRILRLRRRLAALDLELDTVRGEGYLLHHH
jgi:DNA-binding response OmpR family regulator